MDLEAMLRSLDVDPAVIEQAAADGPAALAALGFERHLLGEPLYTPRDAWTQAGTPEVVGRALWQAMGFAQLPDGQKVLTEADMDALRLLQEVLQRGVTTVPVAIAMAHVMGQAMARVADALTGLLIERFAEAIVTEVDAEDTTSEEKAEAADESLLPLLGIEGIFGTTIMHEMTQYILSRHLIASVHRALSTARIDHGPAEVVGFVDIVGYTELAASIPASDLAVVLDRFERLSSSLIAERGARVVKLIGDEAMFVAPDPLAGAQLALELIDIFEDDRAVPGVRVGLALGELLHRYGDCFGPVVNLASRAVSVANPQSILIDEALNDALLALEDVEDPSTVGPDEPIAEFEIKSIHAKKLKGIGRTQLYVLRRPLKS